MSTCLEGKWDPPVAICIPSDQGKKDLQESILMYVLKLSFKENYSD